MNRQNLILFIILYVKWWLSVGPETLENAESFSLVIIVWIVTWHFTENIMYILLHYYTLSMIQNWYPKIWLKIKLNMGTHMHTQTHTHTFIPWFHKCVIKTVGCWTSHKYTYTYLQCLILQTLQKYYNSSVLLSDCLYTL